MKSVRPYIQHQQQKEFKTTIQRVPFFFLYTIATSPIKKGTAFFRIICQSLKKKKKERRKEETFYKRRGNERGTTQRRPTSTKQRRLSFYTRCSIVFIQSSSGLSHIRKRRKRKSHSPINTIHKRHI